MSFTFVDIFAGIGGFRKGFEAASGECIFTCEWNKFSQQTYKANFGTDYIAGDIREIPASEIPRHDVLVAGFPCFGKDTMVLTDQGYLPIQELVPGQLVLTHLGRWRRITHVMERFNISTRLIKAQGVPKLVTTDDHPIFTRTIRTHDSRTTKRLRWLEESQWTPAKDLNDSTRVGQVLPEIGADEFTAEYWWLVGRYLADGYVVKRHYTGAGNPTETDQGRVVITCNRSETEELTERILAAGYHATLSHDVSADKHIIIEQNLYRWLAQFGKYAHGKRLPALALELNQQKSQALLEGYLSGDGSIGTTKGATYWSVSSVSKSLALGMALLSQRAYGVVASVNSYTPSPTTEIKGRVVNQRPCWQVRIPSRNRSGIVDGNYGWKKVRTNEPTGRTETVWNLSVEEDESYMADGLIVHNCQSFSSAGVARRRMLGRSTGFADKSQGTLFFELVRLIEYHRPKAFLLENVKNLLSHDRGRTFNLILAILEQKLQYHVSWRLIDARYWVPQHRERVYIAGVRDDNGLDLLRMPIPDANPVLKDILHVQDGTEGSEPPYTLGDYASVNPKYTISERLWNYLQGHATRQKSLGHGYGFGIIDGNEVTRTLTAHYHKDGAEILLRQEGNRPRRLTPRECSRLMGFDTFQDSSFIIPVSDTQAYKQFGNAVCPPVVDSIANFMKPWMEK